MEGLTSGAAPLHPGPPEKLSSFTLNIERVHQAPSPRAQPFPRPTFFLR
jgi:hypothetical protein